MAGPLKLELMTVSNRIEVEPITQNNSRICTTHLQRPLNHQEHVYDIPKII